MEIFDSIKTLGTDFTVLIATEDQDKAKEDIKSACEIADSFDKQFSRFRKDSELTRLNTSLGENFTASEEMFDILTKSQKFHKLTGGIFDPSILETLENIGYKENFDTLNNEVAINSPLDIEGIINTFFDRPSFSISIIDKEAHLISIPKGLKIDLGGIGKGYLLDLLSKKLKEKYNNFWISAGGDMVLSGKNSTSGIWQIGVQNPKKHEEDLLKIRVLGDDLSVATSGVTKRKGTRGDLDWHHIIDPRTGLPVVNNILATTVIAKTATEADIFAKTTLILGKEEGVNFINKLPNTECLIIDDKMNITFSKQMRNYII